mmetsp:Transcript_17817/g.51036  ORF Transcript_17817/g.51036 Transcript_17817/m.51036 type:complete len:81 (+) Transcript_17817:274-516(+)
MHVHIHTKFGYLNCLSWVAVSFNKPARRNLRLLKPSEGLLPMLDRHNTGWTTLQTVLYLAREEQDRTSVATRDRASLIFL